MFVWNICPSLRMWKIDMIILPNHLWSSVDCGISSTLVSIEFLNYIIIVLGLYLSQNG